MINVKLEFSQLEPLEQVIEPEKIKALDYQIRAKTGLGSEFLGWLEWPQTYNRQEYQLMKESAQRLQHEIEVLVVIGIGGSYLGTRAAKDMIQGLYPQNRIELIYLGQTLSSTYTHQVRNYLKNKKYGLCVISKSGTTTEPGIAFRLFEKDLIKQVGREEAKQLVVAITDQHQGALKTLADHRGYQTFTIPDDIGGRFSVLTPVGIYPLMVAGVETDEIFNGASQAALDLSTGDLTNPAYQYAAARHLLNTQAGYKVEALVNYETQMQYFNEWWKQLFGESEGKKEKGLLPTSMIFSTDLHSLGQWVQDGAKGILFETILTFNQPTHDVTIPLDEDNYDGLNYLSDKTLDEINQTAYRGVLEAHAHSGRVPNIIVEIDNQMNAYTFGYLVYFFELAVAMSGYLLTVNPFDQPGVEIYKKKMFDLLGRP